MKYVVIYINPLGDEEIIAHFNELNEAENFVENEGWKEPQSDFLIYTIT